MARFHGTNWTYQQELADESGPCDECRAAHREMVNRQRAKNRQPKPAPPQGYSAWAQRYVP